MITAVSLQNHLNLVIYEAIKEVDTSSRKHICASTQVP